MLERRHLVGGAAITEELRPGFWFTTFSYALSLLQPEIVHELDLVKHGFMPLLMPSTFCPMENGDYLLMGEDHGENIKEIRRHSKHDADAYDRFNHDLDNGAPGGQAALRRGAAEPVRHDPGGAARARRARRPGRRRPRTCSTTPCGC